MADINVKILEAAENFNFMTVEQARLSMQIDPSEPGGSDDYLRFLIEQNSDVVSTLCNRVFARERVRETWRCLGEPCDCNDARSSRRLFLSHWPVREEEIERVEVPRGNPVDPDCWELDERAGKLSIYCGTYEPIVVTYWGGYELPDEAPPALRYAAMLLVTSARTEAQLSKSQATKMAGIKSIGHKSARVTYEAGGTTIQTAAGGAPGVNSTPAMSAVKDVAPFYALLGVRQMIRIDVNTEALEEKFEALLGKIETLPNAMEDELRSWQNDDMNRRTPIVARTEQSSVETVIWPRQYKPKVRKPGAGRRRGRPAGMFGRRIVQPLPRGPRQPRIATLTTRRPIVRPELMDQLVDRIRGARDRTVVWR